LHEPIAGTARILCEPQRILSIAGSSVSARCALVRGRLAANGGDEASTRRVATSRATGDAHHAVALSSDYNAGAPSTARHVFEVRFNRATVLYANGTASVSRSRTWKRRRDARRRRSALMRWIAVIFGLACAGISAYGWWFYFAVGPAHGPGLELALAGAMLAAFAFFLAVVAGRPPRE